ncbi:hypothetical protein ACC671_22330 [Rhizobium ruizarguesonis]
MTTASNLSDFQENYYLRRYQTAGSSYGHPVTPYPGECLVDLLIRAACENGFPPAMSDRMLGIPDSITRMAPDRNRYGITAEALAILLGNHGGPEEVRPLLHDAVPPRRHLRPFFDTWLDENAFCSTRRVSPRALRKAPFLRAIWRIWPIGFDPETKELLIKDCPVCQQRLKLKFMDDVWCCDRCLDWTGDGDVKAVDLREHEQELVADDLWEDLDFVTSFIDPTARDRRRLSRGALHADFDDMTDGEVFELIYAVARSLPGSIAPGNEISPGNLAAAGAIVRGWPDAFAAHYGQPLPPGVQRNHTLSGIVHNSRLNKGIRGRMIEICRAWSVRSALAALPAADATADGHEFRLIRNWVSRGALKRETFANTEAVLLRARPDVRTVSERLGVSIPSFISMSDGEIFPSQPSSAEARSQLPDYVGRLTQRINVNSQTTPVPKHAIRLPRAVSCLFLRPDDPWRNVVGALVSGRIRYWKTSRSSASILETLYVKDLHEVRSILCEVPEGPEILCTVPLSKLEAGYRTRLQEAGFSAVAKAGLLLPPFTPQSIATFQREFEPSNLWTARYLPEERKRMMPEMFRSLTDAGIAPVTLNYNGTTTVWRREQLDRHFGTDLVPCIR